MTAAFKEIRKLQGERVRMKFDDGREVVAQLLCATRDMDGSKHLIYDKVESGQPADGGAEKTGCFYADAKTLVSIEHADAKNFVSGPRGRDHLTLRSQFEQNMPKALRPSD
jgi:hypothetical protein